MMAYSKEPQATKSLVLSITLSNEVTEQIRNVIYQIQLDLWPMLSKLHKVMAYKKDSLPTMVTWQNSHVTNKNHYIYFYKIHGYHF